MKTVPTKITYGRISKVLEEALFRDRNRILAKARRVFGDRRNPVTEPDAEAVTELALEASAAVEYARTRAGKIPEITYPEQLPVSREKDDIIRLIKDNQVVIVAGYTGSGKTTQLPKICLEAGLGRRGKIGHTQPRRLAARTVADRISQELRCELGTVVGYKVRFGDKTSDDTIIKLMTDGILLTELEQDRYLSEYEVIIIDEAHERSLNIDFILGFLKNLLKKRPDLKVIITSATIDPESFSRHFDNAPVKLVEGRTYPVEVRYQPLDDLLDDDNEEIDEDILQAGILRAVKSLDEEMPGDILVFLNGERDIAETAEYLRRANLPATEILPLYSRLGVADQNKIFAPHGLRRIVLATNVAETSVTVPGIKYVIDHGTARISRYSYRNKVQRLPIEPVSRASADQRKGRCGRVSEGVCVRLYSENDFLARPEFTDPEILRTNLAAVILRMISLRLGSIETFPLLDRPEQRQINDGIKLLEELGAVFRNPAGELRLTDTGRKMAALPCDPRLARMLVEAGKLGALSEVLIITSNLSSQEVRERPLTARNASQECHKRFDDERSDFIGIINLYNYLKEQSSELSGSALRKKMRREFLSYMRMREWLDIHAQLKDAVKELGFKLNEAPATYEEIHKSLLSGLLSMIGMRSLESNEYIGTRSNRFMIFPGSGLARRNVRWVMAAELTETTRLYARMVAEIDPLWVEDYAGDLIRYSYSDEHWSKKMGAVQASQKGVLYGLAVINGRRVNYTRINPPLCHELFIREGLVNGEIVLDEGFFDKNRKLISEVVELEEKSRRRDLLVNDDTLFAFYDERIPEDIGDVRTFCHWWKGKKRENPDFLSFSLDMLKRQDTSMVSEDKYPDHLTVGKYRLNLEYNFDPTAENDGVTAIIPVSILNQVPSDVFEWLIPGLRLELFTTMIRILPKALRKCFVPAPDYGNILFESLDPSMGSFKEALCRKMTSLSGQQVTWDDFDISQLPKHLTFNFRVTDIKRKVLMESRDLEHIRHTLRDEVKASLAEVVKEMPKQEGIKTWNFDSIPKTQSRMVGGMEIVAYPALRDCKDSVSLELFETAEEAERQMWQGQKRLIMLTIPDPISYLEKSLPNKAKLAMYFNMVGNVRILIDDLESLALDDILTRAGGVASTSADFEKLVNTAREEIHETVHRLSLICEKILVKANDVRKKLKGKMDFRTAYAYSDMGGQLSALIRKGFATEATMEFFPRLEVYLDAMLKRMEKVGIDPNRDAVMLNKFKSVEDNYNSLMGLFAGRIVPADVHRVRYMLEELRVSYFAQSIRTLFPVSDKRLNVEIDRLRNLYRK